MKNKKLFVSIASVSILSVFIISLVYILYLPNTYPVINRPDILPAGWQFYSNPTTLEPVGTIFRINENGVKYIVDNTSIHSRTGKEEIGRIFQRISTKSGLLAQLLKITFRGDLEGMREISVEFELKDVERALTTDVHLKSVKDTFFENYQYYHDCRYFIIREAKSAKSIKYILSDKLVGQLGGEAELRKTEKLGVDIKLASNGQYILEKSFGERMGVIYLPYEIVLSRSSLSNDEPKLDIIPVKEILVWNEDKGKEHPSR